MENVFEKLDNLAKTEQNQLLIVGSIIIMVLMVYAYQKRRLLTKLMLFVWQQFMGAKKPYHPSFKDRPNVRIK